MKIKQTKKNDVKTNVEHLRNMHYSLVFEGILVGLVAGLVSALYRFILGNAEELRIHALAWAQGSILNTCIWIFIVILIGIFLSILINKENLISGSGIPQLKAELIGKLKTRWYTIIPAKILGGSLAILSGLSLGREGPSIQLGGMCGKAVSRKLHRLRTEERYLITCGASAGLAVAFNAPLAGVMFALEEVHKNFSATVLVSCMAASLIGDFLCRNIFGLAPIFSLNVSNIIPLDKYGLVIILGIVCGVLGALYNFLIKKFKIAFNESKIPIKYRIFIPLVFALILSFTLPEVVGTGELMLRDLISKQGMLLSTMIIYFTIKLLFSILSFSAGAPGGIFFPLLILGAYIGGASGLIFSNIGIIEQSTIINFIILGMAGYFSAIVRAPITGIILIFEMTASYNHVLSLSIVSIVAYLTAEIMNSAPVYEILLDFLVGKIKDGEKDEDFEKVILNFRVDPGSEAEGKEIRSLGLPKNCLVIAIENEFGETIPDGPTILNAGDKLVVIAHDDTTFAAQALLDRLTTHQIY